MTREPNINDTNEQVEQEKECFVAQSVVTSSQTGYRNDDGQHGIAQSFDRNVCIF